MGRNGKVTDVRQLGGFAQNLPRGLCRLLSLYLYEAGVVERERVGCVRGIRFAPVADRFARLGSPFRNSFRDMLRNTLGREGVLRAHVVLIGKDHTTA